MNPDSPSGPPPREPDPAGAWWPVPEGTIITPPPSPPRRKGPRILVVLGLAVGLVAVAGAAVMALGARAAGADSPQSAVEAMFTALGNEDLAGMVAAMPPGEADPLVEAFGDVGPELRRLGLLPEDFDVRNVAGIDLTFSDLQFRTEELRDGLAAVHITGGEVTAVVTPADLPIGDWLRARIPADALADLPDSSSVTENLGADDLYLVTVRVDGSWYVSLWYTVAELARRDAGAPMPDPALAVAARGTATPEGAVDEMIRAAADLDMRRVLELLPPDEAAALHEYAPLFLDDVDQAMAGLGAGDIGITVNSIDTSATIDGSRAIVKVDGFDIALTEPQLGQTVSLVFDGDCLTVSGDIGFGLGGELFNSCDPSPAGMGGLQLPPELQGLSPDFGIVVVERDGAWYVSPTESLGNAIVTGMKTLDRSTLDGLMDLLEGLDPAGFGMTEQSWTAS